MKKFIEKYNLSESLSEIFELVKEGVKNILGKERAGLMLGLTDLGMNAGWFIGGFYPVSSNIIVMNKIPLRVLEETQPELVKPYCFHILLHEYLHSLGILDEKYTEMITYFISRRMFGEEYIATKMSRSFSKYFPNFMFPRLGWQPQSDYSIELVQEFDSSNISYIG